jgi:hypothetical protein
MGFSLLCWPFLLADAVTFSKELSHICKVFKTLFPAFLEVRPPHCPTDRQRTEASTAASSPPWTGWAASSTAWPQPSASRRSRRRGWKRESGLPIPSPRPGCQRKRSDCEYLFVFCVAYWNCSEFFQRTRKKDRCFFRFFSFVAFWNCSEFFQRIRKEDRWFFLSLVFLAPCLDIQTKPLSCTQREKYPREGKNGCHNSWVS